MTLEDMSFKTKKKQNITKTNGITTLNDIKNDIKNDNEENEEELINIIDEQNVLLKKTATDLYIANGDIAIIEEIADELNKKVKIAEEEIERLKEENMEMRNKIEFKSLTKNDKIKRALKNMSNKMTDEEKEIADKHLEERRRQRRLSVGL